MSEFIQGALALAALFGGLSGFLYWLHQTTEKKLEDKIDSVGANINRIANELVEERRSKDYLYKFVMDYVNQGKR